MISSHKLGFFLPSCLTSGISSMQDQLAEEEHKKR